jgi:hypothetical protein
MIVAARDLTNVGGLDCCLEPDQVVSLQKTLDIQSQIAMILVDGMRSQM